MFDIQREELNWAGRKLVIETGKMARQADGAVVATYGETTVLATVVSEKQPKPGFDFFPLTVNYQERTYAAGRIPGGSVTAGAQIPARPLNRSGRHDVHGRIARGFERGVCRRGEPLAVLHMASRRRPHA